MLQHFTLSFTLDFGIFILKCYSNKVMADMRKGSSNETLVAKKLSMVKVYPETLYFSRPMLSVTWFQSITHKEKMKHPQGHIKDESYLSYLFWQCTYLYT